VAGHARGGVAGPYGGGVACAIIRRLAPPMQVGSLLVASSDSLAVSVEAQCATVRCFPGFSSE
jgi:hypothetical protein